MILHAYVDVYVLCACIVCQDSDYTTVEDQWRQAEGMWIPKEENSKEINQFRIIS